MSVSGRRLLYVQNGNPLQCSCLENPRDWGAWWAAVYGVAQSQTRLKWLSSSSSYPFLKNIYILFGCAGSQLQYLGSSSWTRDWTQAPCIGSMESYPLDDQASAPPCFLTLILFHSFVCILGPPPLWGCDLGSQLELGSLKLCASCGALQAEVLRKRLLTDSSPVVLVL